MCLLKVESKDMGRTQQHRSSAEQLAHFPLTRLKIENANRAVNVTLILGSGKPIISIVELQKGSAVSFRQQRCVITKKSDFSAE